MSTTDETSLLHRGHWAAEGFDALQPGVFKASTITFPDMASFRARDWVRKDRFIYGPHGTPTTFELEARVAALEHGEHCLLFPSGLNAIALLYIALLRPGDELLVPINVVAANRRFVTHELVGWGVKVRLYDPTRPETLAINEATQLIWIEAPCSVTFEFPDVRAIAACAHEHDVLVAVDNTWGAGIAFDAFALGADFSIQSLSKYANGSGDALMGAVTFRDKALHDMVKLCAMRMGSSVSGDDAASVLKGLDTLPLRYRAQDAAARFLVRELLKREGEYRVLHPMLDDCVGHDVWARECTGAAGLFSLLFDPRHGQDDIDRVIDALRLFRIGFGWGSAVSLVLSYGRSNASVAPTQGELVRFSVGLESPADLLADLTQALTRLRRL